MENAMIKELLLPIGVIQPGGIPAYSFGGPNPDSARHFVPSVARMT
jgi:hypothetical protein